MILLRRILPFIGSLAVLGCYAGIVFQATAWTQWIIALVVVVVFSVIYMHEWKWFRARTWLSSFPLIVLLGGGTGMLFFVEGTPLRVILIIALSIIYGVFMENMFTLNYQPAKYTSLSLPKLSIVFNIISAFFLFSTLFALQLIGLIPAWLISVAALIFGGVHMAYLLRGFNVSPEKGRGMAVMVSIIFAEAVTALHFLPSGFYVNGAFAAIMIYFVTSYYLMVAREAYTRRFFIEIIVLSVVLLVLLFVTTQWTY